MTSSSLSYLSGTRKPRPGAGVRSVIRLAYCTDNFQIGGTELNAVRWAEHLSPERFQLTVVHFQADGPLRTRYEQTGAHLFHVPLRNMYGPGAVRQGMRLARFLARERIQVFHAHDLYSNIFGVLWARLAGVPAVIASRRWWHRSQRPLLQLVNRWAYRAAHRVLANSPSVAGLLTRDEGVPPAKVVCVPNFLAEYAFRPLSPSDRAAWRTRMGVPADALVIGIVARLDRVKDHATLVRAFARVATGIPPVHLLCVGEGPQRAELTSLARALRVEGRIQFPGVVTPPFNLHHLFDVSVLCSVSEGFPNSILEAMAAARPVIATRVGGVPDAIQDGETGVLVPPGDPEALAAALQAVIGAPERARRLGTAAQAHARVEYHESRVIERLSAWYESLATGTGGKA
jgi:glycosyltransferase involved in cell wall biosynthesis